MTRRATKKIPVTLMRAGGPGGIEYPAQVPETKPIFGPYHGIYQRKYPHPPSSIYASFVPGPKAPVANGSFGTV